MIDYAAVLTDLYPSSEWTLNGDTYDGLVWLSDTPKPSQAELDDAWHEVQQRRWLLTMRRQRDRLLAASDWTQMPDSPLTDEQRAAWATYRQALRDAPANWTPAPTWDAPEPPN